MFESDILEILYYGAYIVSVIMLSISCQLCYIVGRQIQSIKIRRYWFLIAFLIGLFVCFYLGILALLFLNLTHYASMLTWFILLMGSIFVLFVVRIGIVSYFSMNKINENLHKELEEAGDLVKHAEKTSKAVAKANINIASLYADLEAAQEELERNEESLEEQNKELFNSNKSLAEANANMAELYIELDNTRHELIEKNNELEQVNNEITNINRLAHVVNTSLNIKEVAESFINSLSEVFNFSLTTMHHIDHDDKRLIQEHIFGLSVSGKMISEFKKLKINIEQDEPLLIKSLRLADPVYVEDSSTINEFDKFDLALIKLIKWKSVIYFPLIIQNQVIGCIGFYSVNNCMKLTKQTIKRVEDYLVLASTAMNNAKMYHKLKKTKLQLAESEKINALTTTFQKFVPKQFLKKIAKKGIENIDFGKAELEELGILFVDIRNFTHLSDKLSEPLLYNYINKYLDYICRAIYRNNGFVDKFLGDGIMSLFDNDSTYHFNAATNAVYAAIEMHKMLKLFNTEITDVPMKTEIGIGVHVGETLIGTVGTLEHYESTVIGENVGISARIEQLTKTFSTDIIISESTLNKIDPSVRFKCRTLGFAYVKGIEKAINLFEIYDHHDPKLQAIKARSNSMIEEACYELKAKRYEKGLKILKEAIKQNPEDSVLARLYEYNRDFVMKLKDS